MLRMKIIAITIGFAIASLSCMAQSTTTNSVGSDRFLICYQADPVCKIQGFAPSNGTSYGHQGPVESVARRLQTYFYQLSGCKVPIKNIDPTPANKRIARTIFIDSYAPSAGMPHVRITLRPFSPTYKMPVLYVSDVEFGRALKRQDGKIVEIERPRALLQQALDAFGQKYFGVPVSAIDDPKFDWSSHHTNTLAISYADFQTIQFGPANQ